MTGKTMKTILVSIGVVVAVIAVGLIIAVNVINGKIESEAAGRLDEAIASSGMEENLSYGEIKAESAKGRLSISDFAYLPAEEGSGITASSISIDVPPGEALALANDPQNATLSRVEFTGNEMVFTETKTGTKTTFDLFSFSAEGELGQSLMNAEAAEFMRKVSSVKMSIENSQFEPGEQLKMQLQLIPGAAALISEGALNVGSMEMEANLSPERAEVKKIALESGLMTFDGNIDVKLNEARKATEIGAKLAVEDMHAELRKNLAPLFQQFGQSLPEEGPFDFELKLPQEGVPELTVTAAE